MNEFKNERLLPMTLSDQSSKIPLYHDDDDEDDDDDYATREKDLVEKIGRLLNYIVLGSVSSNSPFIP